MRLKWIWLFFVIITMTTHADESKLPTHIIKLSGHQVFETETLYEALSVDTKSFFQFWKDDIPRIKDKLIPTLDETLKSFYDSEGFYDAKFIINETNTTVEITIKEKLPVKVTQIEIESDFNITKLILLKKDTRFRAKDFIATKSSIIQALLDKGHCSYDLDNKAYVDLDKREAVLKYKLNKGGICTFGKANIQGLESIDEEVILSRVRAKEGERFDPKKVKETYSGIYALNSFDTVQINVDRKIYNVVPVDITLHEVEDAYHLELGAGYDTYVGPRVHASLLKKNFFGNAQQTGIKLSWSPKEQLAVGEFFKPALFFLYGYGIDFGTEFGYSNLEFRGFQERKGFGKFYLEHNEGRLKLRTGLALENIDIELLNNLKANEELAQAINDGNYFLLYPYADVVYDARDDKLNPKSGYYLATSVELGLPYEPQATTYLKMFLEGRYIHTIDKLTLSSVGKVGVVDEFKHELPESKLFFAGGSFSNRAYGFNTIGVIESPKEDSIRGASTLLNLSLEANYPIVGNFYGALFTDNTMLNEESYDFEGDIITSAGVGVRYLTPIGPFKLDVGFNVHKPKQYGISFQIGQSF